jgi:hypothetical protein
MPTYLAGIIPIGEFKAAAAGRERRQHGAEIDVDTQRKSALLGGKTARPVAGAQRQRAAVDAQLELPGDLGGEARNVGIPFRLRSDAVAVGVGSV